MAKKYQRVGQMLQSKAGGYYLKFKTDDNSPVVIESDDVIFMDKPEDVINKMLEMGKLSEQEAQERISKVPGFVKFNLTKVTEE